MDPGTMAKPAQSNSGKIKRSIFLALVFLCGVLMMTSMFIAIQKDRSDDGGIQGYDGAIIQVTESPRSQRTEPLSTGPTPTTTSVD